MSDKADEKKSRMAPRHDAPPGLEQDSHGNTIPIDQRTLDDQEKARSEKRAQAGRAPQALKE